MQSARPNSYRDSCSYKTKKPCLIRAWFFGFNVYNNIRNIAAYGYNYRYDGFGGSVRASQSAAWSRTLTEHRRIWITDGSGNACTERNRSATQYLQYLPFGESFID